MRACENHGIRDLPYRFRSYVSIAERPAAFASLTGPLPHAHVYARPYSPEDERYPKNARFLSVYYDAPKNTKSSMEISLRLHEQVLRFTTFRQKSIIDEVATPLPSHVCASLTCPSSSGTSCPSRSA